VELPAVIWNVQRVGPSTGLPTRTAQGDLLSTAFLSHGDTKQVMLFPASVHDCFVMAGAAFDLAETLQTPVFVMSDLDLGMNNWMSDPFEYPTEPLKRGKVLSKEELEKVGSFARYKDVDGDGIGYRTVPGTEHANAAWFARGSGHNERAQYTERPDDYVNNVDRLLRKWETAKKLVPKPVVTGGGHKVGVIAFGTTHWAMGESLAQLKKETGLEMDYLRLQAYPFTEEVLKFIADHERVYVVDQNRDGQMMQLLKLDLDPLQVPKLRSVRHYNGLPIDARSITDEIARQEKK
jgi:2-oxoglutarate/2-oxoacid ferredoxin oxidoreductase subunit alpha